MRSLALALVALLAHPALAEETTFTAKLSPGFAPWTETVEVPPFDASLGTLEAVHLAVLCKVEGAAGLENLGAEPVQGTLRFGARLEVDVLAADGDPDELLARRAVAFALGAFDGQQDFSGSSGIRLSRLNAGERSERELHLAPWLVGRPVTLQVRAFDASKLDGDPEVELRTRVRPRAELIVTFTYRPLADCDGDGVPDTLEPDCDDDGTPDDCEPDCDEDGIPDDCEPDSDGDGLPDDCDRDGVGHDSPGSLLVFPEYDNRDGRTTILTVTDRNLDPTSVGVFVKYVYVQGSNCTIFNRRDFLTPGDTRTVLTTAHMPASTDRGYVYVYAEDALTEEPVAHNSLIGTATHTDGFTTFNYGFRAVSFRSPRPDGEPTDVDGDSLRDLDGVEYAPAPDKVLVPRFLGAVGTFSSDLILLHLSSALDAQVVTGLLVWNDNEDVFSAKLEHDCWDRTPLASISTVFLNSFLQGSNQDPLEIVGASDVEAGWFLLDGILAIVGDGVLEEPAVLGMLVEGAASSRSAALPFFEGTRTNGSLFDHD